MAQMDPWCSLKITSEMLIEATTTDAPRIVLAAAMADALVGAVMFRPRDGNSFMFMRKFGEALARHWGRPWPCDPDKLPAGGYVNALAVFPNWQGHGIGKTLLSAAEAVTAEQSPRIYLSVSESNVDARRMYESVGYRLVGTVHDCLREGNTELLHLKPLRIAGAART